MFSSRMFMISFPFNSLFDQSVIILSKGQRPPIELIKGCLFKSYYCKGVTTITFIPVEIGRGLKESEFYRLKGGSPTTVFGECSFKMGFSNSSRVGFFESVGSFLIGFQVHLAVFNWSTIYLYINGGFPGWVGSYGLFCFTWKKIWSLALESYISNSCFKK